MKCFSCLLKEATEVAVVAQVGILFRAGAAIIRKDRPLNGNKTSSSAMAERPREG